MIPIYTLEKHLLLCGDLGEKYKALHNIFIYNKALICDVIDETDRYFSFYSSHDSTHSETIISSIESLLGERGIKELSPTDTFLLLFAAYLHDFGMCLQYRDINEMLRSGKFNEFVKEKSTEKDFENYTNWLKNNDFKQQFFDEITWPLDAIKSINILLSEYYRKSHGDESEKKIREQFKNTNININPHKRLPERLELLLARICSLHTKDFSNVMGLDYETNGAFNDKAHPRFISVLIRLGDLLDLDNNRFKQTKLSTLCDEMPGKSKVHYDKHNSVKSFLITPQKINIVAESNDDEVLREMRTWVSWLEKEIVNIGNNWSDIVPNNFFGAIPKLSYDIKKSNSEIIFANKNLKVSLPEKKAFQIIQGANIYKHNLIFIREYIQNGIDAIKKQFLLDQLHELDNFNVNDNFETEDDKIKFICEKYYNEALEETMGKYGVNIRLFNCNNESEIEAFRSYFNSTSYRKEDFKGKIIIVVEDNGTGISVDDINNRILEAGKKDGDCNEKLNDLLKKMPAVLRPTGAFGIGLHSGFLITDKIIIHTRTAYDKYKGREIIIESGTKTGYVQCNVWDKEDEVRNAILRGTQVIMSIDTDNIIVDDKYIRDSDKFEFPFGRDKKSHLINYIVNVTQSAIKQPTFNIRLIDYMKRDLHTIQRNHLDLEAAKDLVFDKKVNQNSKDYYVKVYKRHSSRKEWQLTVTDSEMGNSLVLRLGNVWDADKIITTSYKGVVIDSKELEKGLKSYLIFGTEAFVNYSFEETQGYITINRDDVTKKGEEVCKAIFEELMYVGLESIRVYVMEKYSGNLELETYINARRLLEPIAIELNKQFSDYIYTIDKNSQIEFKFIPKENYNNEKIQKLVNKNKIELILEVFVKLLASKMWDTIDAYEDYNLQTNLEMCKKALYIAISELFMNFKTNEASDEFLSNEYIEYVFSILSSEIGGYALGILGDSKNTFSRPTYKAKDGQIKNVKQKSRDNIPALAIFLYHSKYGQESLLDENYRNILEVFADRYICDLSYGFYRELEENRFKNVFLYKIVNSIKPIIFGSDAIANYNNVYLANDEFFSEEKGNLNSIYPIEYMNVKNKKFNPKYYVQFKNKKVGEGESVFIQGELEGIRDYLFSDIIESNYIDIDEIGPCYFKGRNIYCMPAVEFYTNIAVKKMPYEFMKCYKESKFRFINQNSYIMVPIDKDVLNNWGECFRYSYSDNFKKNVLECRNKLKDDSFLADIKKHELDDKLYRWDHIEEDYIEYNIKIYKVLLNDLKKIRESESFFNIVEYTLENKSYRSNEKMDAIREKIGEDYLKLLRDLFVYIIDFFYE